MPRVTGIGGVFFKSADPQKLYAWYEKHLGVKADPNGDVMFRWPDADGQGAGGMTVWALFPRDSTYFDPNRSDFMINYRVDDLDGLLQSLRREGIWIDEKREDH